MSVVKELFVVGKQLEKFKKKKTKIDEKIEIINICKDMTRPVCRVIDPNIRKSLLGQLPSWNIGNCSSDKKRFPTKVIDTKRMANKTRNRGEKTAIKSSRVKNPVGRI